MEISGIKVKKSIAQEGETPVATVQITGKGRLKSGQLNSVSEQRQLEKKIEKQLTADLAETAEGMRKELGVDMANSYISLGGKNRALYRLYQGVPELYNRKVRQVFEVDITILNWE